MCRDFFFEAVQPITVASFPDLRYSAALIGPGSEAIGCDDRRSADHHYGPRVLLFLDPAKESCRDELDQALRNHLPVSFGGYPTNFGAPNPNDNGVRLLQAIDSGPVNHMIQLLTVRPWFLDYLGWDIDQPLNSAAWLTFPQQKLLTITVGEVFRDDLGLSRLREQLAWYPHDVWLYMLAAGWNRIGQEEHLMGRAGEVGDEVGSALIAARLVHDVMSLCFLMARRYAPYPKWFGTHFARLPIGSTLLPILRGAQTASCWQDREKQLVQAWEILAEHHNALALTDPLPTKASAFWGRPFQVIHGERFAEALIARITDPAVQAIAHRTCIGSIDQFSDNTDLREGGHLRLAIERLYCSD
jgi:hypothetical protein